MRWLRISKRPRGFHNVLTLFSLLLVTERIRSLELLELSVPARVPLGARARLACRWRLGPADALYSLKWYKDGKEFFRHVPGDRQPRRTFSLSGVRVEDSDPSGANITLSPASLETSGRYRCEVSGEKPLFRTVSDHADIQVIILPDEGPNISGFRSRYRVGDHVVATCVSGRSHPATELAWYTNGEPAPAAAVTAPDYREHDGGFVTTRLTLGFTVSDEHFEENRLRVKCLATLPPFYWKSNEEIALRERSVTYKDLEIRSTQKKSQRPRSQRANQVNLGRRNKYSLEIISTVSLIVLCKIY